MTWNPKDTPEWFWQLIDGAGRDRHKFRESLQALSQGELYDVSVYFNRLAEELMDPLFREPGANEDTIFDITDWAIAQGKAYFFDVYEHPEKIPRTPPEGPGLGFKSMIGNTMWDKFGVELTG